MMGQYSTGGVLDSLRNPYNALKSIGLRFGDTIRRGPKNKETLQFDEYEPPQLKWAYR